MPDDICGMGPQFELALHEIDHTAERRSSRCHYCHPDRVRSYYAAPLPRAIVVGTWAPRARLEPGPLEPTAPPSLATLGANLERVGYHAGRPAPTSMQGPGEPHPR